MLIGVGFYAHLPLHRNVNCSKPFLVEDAQLPVLLAKEMGVLLCIHKLSLLSIAPVDLEFPRGRDAGMAHELLQHVNRTMRPGRRAACGQPLPGLMVRSTCRKAKGPAPVLPRSCPREASTRRVRPT